VEDEGRVSGSSDFGALLRRYRRAAGLSQEALAERARMSTNGIGALERGYRRSPQRETLALLAGALALDGEQRREFEAAARPGLVRRPATPTGFFGQEGISCAILTPLPTKRVKRDRNATRPRIREAVQRGRRGGVFVVNGARTERYLRRELLVSRSICGTLNHSVKPRPRLHQTTYPAAPAFVQH
jgi:transcriptional regulator with XRE-family HTH domain